MGKRQNVKDVSRKTLEFMGLKVERDLEENLQKASKEEMEEWHKLRSFRKGMAGMGVAINGPLGIIGSPTNLVAAAYSGRQAYVAHREQRKIEKAALNIHKADFRRGENRISRKRHKAAGAACKLAISVATGFQDDLFTAGFAACEGLVGGLDLGIDHNQATMAKEMASTATAGAESAGLGYLGELAHTQINRGHHNANAEVAESDEYSSCFSSDPDDSDDDDCELLLKKRL
ncbi:hypothetical protein KC19_11G073700 [Ceratodon purpureus]|uniref:Uncharacterized protein n=1 Tax=Ceratodon purpureus TaxID=3225 RepID=A0A8T0GEY6_CERPU|nr:hypothetical protein KC19_11G073700 [Ceratodon purpureus]